jgi:hypothetical protein
MVIFEYTYAQQTWYKHGINPFKKMRVLAMYYLFGAPQFGHLVFARS